MRAITWAGIVLIVVGAFFLFGGTLSISRQVLAFGGTTVSAEARGGLAPWLSTFALIIGFALVVKANVYKT